LVLEHGPEPGSQWEAIRSIAGKLGCSAEALRKWVRQFEIDSGQRERSLTQKGLRGAVRGRAFKRTAIAHESALRPADLVKRDFTADTHDSR
jgi:transposase